MLLSICNGNFVLLFINKTRSKYYAFLGRNNLEVSLLLLTFLRKMHNGLKPQDLIALLFDGNIDQDISKVERASANGFVYSFPLFLIIVSFVFIA